METVVLAILTALGIAIAGYLVTQYGPSVQRFLGRSDVRVTTELDAGLPAIRTENDPGIFEAGFPNWEGYGYVFPGPVETLGVPPTEICREWRDWARRKHGVDARCTKVQVIIEGRSESSVLIDRLEIDVLDRQDALSGTYAACVVGGASASPREIYVALDDDQPTFRFVDRGDEPVGHFMFSLEKGELETFLIYAAANDYYCEWIARLFYVANGRRGIIEVTDGGDPFKTTGTVNAQDYAWYGGEWRRGWFSRGPSAR